MKLLHTILLLGSHCATAQAFPGETHRASNYRLIARGYEHSSDNSALRTARDSYDIGSEFMYHNLANRDDKLKLKHQKALQWTLTGRSAAEMPVEARAPAKNIKRRPNIKMASSASSGLGRRDMLEVRSPVKTSSFRPRIGVLKRPAKRDILSSRSPVQNIARRPRIKIAPSALSGLGKR